ncbi:YveK family protein [Allokutzneria albata]|uniref:Capsular polysaccharide biosynthesis protein n=1 Tax=Allokutzneria albata TaxID=211114 RepID=A0A1H0CFL6_ALLAB|nr:hypothetical protein [Allokutzneria albata]SDN56581.1 hypothetical protein SAMN04489726_7196 [Allokutzneria albata]
MDALDLLRTVRRRWALAAVLAVGLAALLTSVAFLVPQQYRANASMLVLRAHSGEDRNPFAAVDPAQGQAAILLLKVVNTPPMRQRMAAQGATAELEISNEGSGTVAADSPFITVVATGQNPESVRATVDIAMRELRTELKRRQDEMRVPPEGQLSLTVIVGPETITTTRSEQLRALAISGGIGLVLLLAIVVMVDRAQQRRARVPFALARKQEEAEPEPVDPEPSVQLEAERSAAARAAVARVTRNAPTSIDRETDALGIRYQRPQDRASR